MPIITDNPIEFLNTALQKADLLSELETGLNKLKEDHKTISGALESAKNELSVQIDSETKKRRTALESGYDKQIAQISSNLKKVQAKRDKAKNRGIKERIEDETRDLFSENKLLKNQIASVLQQDRAPSFCKSSVFFTLFYPKGFREILLFFLTFLIVFAALPFILYQLIPNPKGWYMALIYVIDILLFGFAYISINNRTRVKHTASVSEARKLRDRINANKKKIRSKTKHIKRDTNEDHYDLKEFDDELAKLKQSLSDTSIQKRDALNTFETVTKNILSDEIEQSFSEKLGRLTLQLSDLDSKLTQMQAEFDQKHSAFVQEYEQYLGNDNLNSESISSLIQLIESGNATNISDAILKLGTSSNTTLTHGRN